MPLYTFSSKNASHTHWIKAFTLSLLLCTLAVFSAATVAGKLYRWVDEEGKVHYSDRVPPDQSRNERRLLDRRGFELDRVEKAKSKQEIAREEELMRLRAEKQRLIEQQKKRDEVLLSTFRTEDDLLMASNGRIASIDTIIQITRTSIRQMKDVLARFQKRAADLERHGKQISQNLLKSIDTNRLQLQNAYAFIIKKEQEKEAVISKTKIDLARFRALKKIEPKSASPVSISKSGSLLETVVICDDENVCREKWSLAETYVRKHSTTRIQMLSKTIIMTSAALKDSDISITVSKIREKNVPGAKLFMDLQCKDSPRGADLCKSDSVEQIRIGFKYFLNAKGEA